MQLIEFELDGTTLNQITIIWFRNVWSGIDMCNWKCVKARFASNVNVHSHTIINQHSNENHNNHITYDFSGDICYVQKLLLRQNRRLSNVRSVHRAHHQRIMHFLILFWMRFLRPKFVYKTTQLIHKIEFILYLQFERLINLHRKCFLKAIRDAFANKPSRVWLVLCIYQFSN